MISKPQTNVHSLTDLHILILIQAEALFTHAVRSGCLIAIIQQQKGDNNNITRDKALFFFWLLHAKVIETFRFANLLLRRFSKSILLFFPCSLLWYVVHIYFLIKSHFTFIIYLFMEWRHIPNCSRAFDIAICGGMLLIGFLVATSTYATRILTHFFGRLHTILCMQANVYSM